MATATASGENLGVRSPPTEEHHGNPSLDRFILAADPTRPLVAWSPRTVRSSSTGGPGFVRQSWDTINADAPAYPRARAVRRLARWRHSDRRHRRRLRHHRSAGRADVHRVARCPSDHRGRNPNWVSEAASTASTAEPTRFSDRYVREFCDSAPRWVAANAARIRREPRTWMT